MFTGKCVHCLLLLLVLYLKWDEEICGLFGIQPEDLPQVCDSDSEFGERPVLSTHGAVTSLAWGMDGKVDYVLEGNINYTGAVISWLKDSEQWKQMPARRFVDCVWMAVRQRMHI